MMGVGLRSRLVELALVCEVLDGSFLPLYSFVSYTGLRLPLPTSPKRIQHLQLFLPPTLFPSGFRTQSCPSAHLCQESLLYLPKEKRGIVSRQDTNMNHV